NGPLSRGQFHPASRADWLSVARLFSAATASISTFSAVSSPWASSPPPSPPASYISPPTAEGYASQSTQRSQREEKRSTRITWLVGARFVCHACRARPASPYMHGISLRP